MAETATVTDEVFHQVKKMERAEQRWRIGAVVLAVALIASLMWIGVLTAAASEQDESNHERACKDNAMAEVLDVFGGTIRSAIEGDEAALIDYGAQINHLGSLREQFADCHQRH